MIVDPSDFRDPLWMMFSGSLLMLTVVIFAGLSALRMFLNHHYGAPLQALVDSINAFSDDPLVARPIADELLRSREFVAAAQALETLQRERLADIGEAVAKINHDIRNVLSSTTLVADTILALEDPRVRRMAPHIVRSLEQSVALCQSMMDYFAESPAAEPVRFAMQELFVEIAESAGIEVRYDGPEEVRLDRTMMSRILLNLAHNAANASAARISIDIWRAGRLGVIDIADDGLGIPHEHWDSLFLAFRSK
ncbi:MAG: ATP-binding protein [Pseudomonadota bacterium]|nr:ATP-binding protein [Pseudomonadota bacterium]